MTERTEQETRDYLTSAMQEVTLETLPAFITDALSQKHEYGTICVALGGIAAAAAKAADRSPQGGITGFQAGAVFWEFMRFWGTFGEGPHKMLSYRDMLYPQSMYKFAPTITPDTWTYLQDEAKKLIEEGRGAHPAVQAHWDAIAAGKLPEGVTVVDD